MTIKNKHTNLYLDTNILLNNPKVFYDLQSEKVKKIIISEITLAELDQLKKEAGEKGRGAREVIRELLKIIDNHYNINDKQELCIAEVKDDETIKNLFNTSQINNDDRIISHLKDLHNSAAATGEKTLFLTLDNIAYIKAVNFIQKNNLDIDAELFDVEKTNKHIYEEYTGRTEVYASDEAMVSFNEQGVLDVKELFVFDEKTAKNKYLTKKDLVINEFLIINSTQNNSSLLGYFDGMRVKKLEHGKEYPYGVKPKNVGQIFLQEALMRDVDDAPLVICKGPAGTAKTFYSIAVGLHKVLAKEKEFKKILCCRPNVQMDEDLGFLPGDEQEKIAPYFRPVIDNLEALIGNDSSKCSVKDLIDFGHIQFEAVAFMRGRSIVNTYLIVDEAQNLTITQVKGIITRAGEGTKVILAGDPEQIDNPYLDKYNNGLSYASNKMKGSRYCWQIVMDEGEGVRSKLATEAAKKL